MPEAPTEAVKLLIAIDGTGTDSDALYALQCKQSFTYQIFEGAFGESVPQGQKDIWDLESPHKFYSRGPTISGGEDPAIEERAYNWLVGKANALPPGTPIELYLTGWSRGAWICIVLAKKIAANYPTAPEAATVPFPLASALLQTPVSMVMRTSTPAIVSPPTDTSSKPSRPISIEHMLLFDPVDMDLTVHVSWSTAVIEGPSYFLELELFDRTDTNMLNSLGPVTLPANVKSAFNLTTDPSQTRPGFRRVQLSPKPKVLVTPPPYPCTHSGVGGLPEEGDNRGIGDRDELVLYKLETVAAFLHSPFGIETMQINNGTRGYLQDQDFLNYKTKVLPDVRAYVTNFGMSQTDIVVFDPKHFPKHL